MRRVVRARVQCVVLGAALAVATSATAQQVRVDMSADRTRIGADEQVTVRIEVQSEGGDSPEVQLPTFEGFQVVSRQVQRPMQFSFSFGSRAVVRSSVIYAFGLSPVRVGKIPIPPVRVQVGGQVFQSKPLTIEVVGAGAAPAQPDAPAPGDTGDDATPDTGEPAVPAAPPGTAASAAKVDDIAFLQTVVDKPRPYEREQVTVTVYLYLRQRLHNTPNVKQEPGTDGFWVHDLLSPNYKLQGQRHSVNGSLYTVYMLRRFAAFPLRSGELTIGPMTVEIDQSSVFDLFGGRRANPVVTRTGVPITLDVQPLPEEGRPANGAFVGSFTLETRLDRDQAVTGDAVTLTATVRGRGDVRAVKLETPSIPGLRILDPQIKDRVESPNDLVSGERVYEWLVVPEQPGEYQIPPIGFDVFDPSTRRYQRVEAPALALTAAGSALPTARTAPGPTPDTAAPEVTPDDEHHWPPIRTQSALERSHSRVVAAPWLPWALALPPLAWLVAVIGGVLRRRARAHAATGRQRALKASQTRADEAKAAAGNGDAAAFHGAAAAALSAMLEARMDAPIGGYTHAELRAHLVARGMDVELAKATVEQLEASDYARFSPDAGSSEALRAAAERLDGTLSRLSRFEPTPEDAP